MVLSPAKRDLLRGLLRMHYAQVRAQLRADPRLTDEGRAIYERELESTRQLLDQVEAEPARVAA